MNDLSLSFMVIPMVSRIQPQLNRPCGNTVGQPLYQYKWGIPYLGFQRYDVIMNIPDALAPNMHQVIRKYGD